jgi:hypothetical protein
VDCRGRVWTPMDWEGFEFVLHGRLWTAMDTAWRSTDQKVGGSSPSGRALKHAQFVGILPCPAEPDHPAPSLGRVRAAGFRATAGDVRRGSGVATLAGISMRRSVASLSFLAIWFWWVFLLVG